MTDQAIIRSGPATADVDLQAIRGVPSDPEKRKAAGNYLIDLFYNALPQQKKDVFNQPDSDESVRRILGNELDAFILSQAQCIGWRILLSDSILERISRWEEPREKNGPKLFEELGKSLALHARIGRGEAQRPIPPEMYELREKAQKELRVLLRRAKIFIAANRPRGLQGSADVISFICREIEADPGIFPTLSGRLESLSGYLRSLEDSLPGFLLTTKQGRFFQEWSAWGENRDPDALRSAISRLGRQIRKP